MNDQNKTREELIKELNELRLENRAIKESGERRTQGKFVREAEQMDILSILKAAMGSLNDTIILTIDSNYNYLYFNVFHKEVMKYAYGIDVEIGMNILECISNEDDRNKSKINYDRALNGEGFTTLEEYGDLIKAYYETKYAPLYNDHQEIIGTIALSSAVTERVRREEIIKNQAELLDLVHDNIFVRDMKSRITFWNKGAEKKYGWESNEVIGIVTHDLLKTIFPVPLEEIEQELALRDYWEGELTHTTKDGTKIVVASRWCLQKNKDNHPVAIIEINDDITSRKLAEIALMENSQRLELAMQSANMAWWEMDVPTGHVIFDQRKSEMLGYSSDMFRHYKDFTTLVHPDDHSRAMEAMQKHLDGSTNHYETEYRILTKSGQYKWFYDIGTVVKKDSEGKPLNITGLVLDITTRKQADAALNESELRHRLLVENSIDAVAYHELIFEGGKLVDYIYLEVNKAFATQTGLRDVTGKKVSDIVPGIQSSNPELFERYERVARTGKPEQYETYIASTGTWYFTSLYSLSHNKAVSVFKNITESKLAEELLRESEEKYRIMFASNPQPMWIYDLETLFFLEVNDAAIVHYGYSKEEFLSMTLKDIRPEEDIEALLIDVEKTRNTFNSAGEWRHRKKNGEIIQVEIVSHSISFNNRKARHVLVNDITQRKHLQTELQENESRLRNVFEQANDGIYIISADNRYLDANEQGLDLLGYSKDELLQMSVAQVLSPKEVSRLAVEPPRMMSGIPHLAEWEHVCKDGSVFLGEVSAKRLNESSYMAIVRNLNERRLAEGKIQGLTERISLATRAASIGIWDWNLADNTLTWDDQMFLLYGVNKTEYPVAYEAWIKGLHPDDRENGELETNLALMGKKDYDTEFRVVWPDGSVHYLKTKADVYRNEEGQPIRMIGVNYDITGSKLAESALIESENKLSLFIEHAPASLAMFDLEMRYIAYSQRWLADYSLSAQKLHGLCHYDIFPEIGSNWKDIHKRGLNGEIVTNDEDLFLRADGTRQWLRWEVRPWFGADKTIHGIVIFSENITERVEIKEELKKLNAELEIRVEQRTLQLNEANKELESFSYSVSHDLRAPLRAINGFARILNDEYGQLLDDEGNRICGIIDYNAKKMGNLIDDLLAFSRYSRKEIIKSPINMKTMVNSIFHEVANEEQRKKIKFSIGEIEECEGDPTLFRQILSNLLSNSIKFTSKTEHPTIEFRSDIRGKKVVYTIQDNGAGFNMKYKDKLFSVFQRLHSASEFEGTGVGLAIVQRIVSRHGGEVGADGEVGKGATFWFSVPK